MASQAQIDANRENAKLSAGPTSPEGIFISRLNAVKNGVWTAPHNLIAGESKDDLEFIIRSYMKRLRPDGPVETGHVENAVRNIWLIYRYDRIEAALIDIEIAKSGKHPDYAYAELLSNPKNNTLRYLISKRNTAQNAWTKAMKELERLQKARGKQFNVEPEGEEDFEIGFVPPASVVLPETIDAIRPATPGIGR